MFQWRRRIDIAFTLRQRDLISTRMQVCVFLKIKHLVFVTLDQNVIEAEKTDRLPSEVLLKMLSLVYLR